MIAAMNILAEGIGEFLRPIIILAIPFGLWIAAKIAEKKEQERKQLELAQQREQQQSAEPPAIPVAQIRRDVQETPAEIPRASLREPMRQPPQYRPQRPPAVRPQVAKPIERKPLTSQLIVSAARPTITMPSAHRRAKLSTLTSLSSQEHADTPMVEMPALSDRRPELPLSMDSSKLAVDLLHRDTATLAVIFKEILGPPKALQTGPEMWDI